MVVKKTKKLSEKPEKVSEPKTKYFEGIGRRKTAIARVRIWPDSKNKEVSVNGKKFFEYFKDKEFRDIISAPLLKLGISDALISIKVSGSGLRAQAFACRHGLSRALAMAKAENRPVLKTLGFLTRDPRMRERKKPGLKGARRAPQWSKR